VYQLRENDNSNIKNGGKLKVFGEGTVSVKPDVAEAMIGVITENTQLEAAQEENARITQQVINSIRALGVSPKNIQTQNYGIRTNYDYINGRQVFRGYEVSNNLKVTIRNIDSVGQIIDTAVQNGANSLSGIIFLVSDQTRHYYEALSLAVEDAQNKARIIANKLKVKLNIIPIQINEQKEETAAPLVMTFKSSGETTPIEAGENIINADIEATFIYIE
jgi:uncharacterized protein YggE